MDTADELLSAYVPRLAARWLDSEPTMRHRRQEGTLLFADISGFTDLTERLAFRGKFGAEEIADLINHVFEEMFNAAYSWGGDLLKWGGDAGLFFFEGDDHASRACTGAWEMLAALRSVGPQRTSAGTIQLKMSVGIHSGELDFLLVGTDHRELIVAGPAASAVSAMEHAAQAGQILLSRGTAAALDPTHSNVLSPGADGGHLLVASPLTSTARAAIPEPTLHDAGAAAALPAGLREHCRSGAVDSEHRHVTVGFIQFTGADSLLATRGPDALADAVEGIVDAVDQACARNRVTLLAIDLYPDGGKALVVAGAPTMWGDNEARLLGAVREVLTSGCLLPLKAGVNSGRAFAGDFGPPYRRNYSLAGDAVNLGARLMAKAGPGEILTTPHTMARSRTAFATTALDPFPVKGKADLVEAVRVGAPLVAGPPGAADTLPLIGRRAEMELLIGLARQVDRSEGQFVEVVGPPGIGKSRLLEELASEVTWPVLRTDGDLYGGTIPYQPFHSLFPALLGCTGAPSSEDVGRTLHQQLVAADPDLAPWIPLVGIVAGCAFPSTPEIDAIDPQLRKERLELSTARALAVLIRQPTLMAFNDVHMMDGASVDLLAHMAAALEHLPLMLVATRRPDGPSPFADAPVVHQLSMSPLEDEAADRLLLAAAADTAIPVHRLSDLVRRAEGNPLFLRELISEVVHGGSFDDLPDSVEEIIATRIDRLSPLLRRFLRSLSVIGATFERDLVDRILEDSSSDQAWQGVADFVRAEPSGRAGFVHLLMQQVAYEGLPERQRVRLHGRAADVISTDTALSNDERLSLLSHHAFRALRYEDAWTFSRQAGERARARYANTDAAALFDRAVAAAHHVRNLPPGDLATVCENLNDIYFDLGEFDDAERVLRRARRLIGPDPLRLAHLHLRFGRLRETAGRLPEALASFSRGLRVLQPLTHREAGALRAELLCWYARIKHFQGRHRECHTWCERAIAEADASGNQHALAWALEMTSWAQMSLGNLDDGEEARRAAAVFASIGDRKGEARAHGLLGARAFYSGHWEDALDQYRAAEQLLHEVGYEWSAATQRANQAEILSDQGRLVEATAALEAAMRVWRGSRSKGDMAFGQYLMGRVAARSGRHAEGIVLFDQSRSYFAQAGETAEVFTVDVLRAEACVLASRFDVALAGVDECLHRAAKQEGSAAQLPLLWRVRGLALFGLGDVQGGQQALQTSLEHARARQARHEIAFTLMALQQYEPSPDAAVGISRQRELDELTTGLGLVGQ